MKIYISSSLCINIYMVTHGEDIWTTKTDEPNNQTKKQKEEEKHSTDDDHESTLHSFKQREGTHTHTHAHRSSASSHHRVHIASAVWLSVCDIAVVVNNDVDVDVCVHER